MEICAKFGGDRCCGLRLKEGYRYIGRYKQYLYIYIDQPAGARRCPGQNIFKGTHLNIYFTESLFSRYLFRFWSLGYHWVIVVLRTFPELVGRSVALCKIWRRLVWRDIGRYTGTNGLYYIDR